MCTVHNDCMQGEKSTRTIPPQVQDTKGKRNEKARSVQVGSGGDAEGTTTLKPVSNETGKAKPVRNQGQGMKTKAGRVAHEVRPN
jgi:hypothetical protein